MACLQGIAPHMEPVTGAGLQGCRFSPIPQRNRLGAQLRSPRGQVAQFPRTVPLILPCEQALLGMLANQCPHSSPLLATQASFNSIDSNHAGVISRSEFEAAVFRSSSPRPGAWQSLLSQQVRHAPVAASGGQLLSRAVSPLRSVQNHHPVPVVAEAVASLQSPEQSLLSPGRHRLVAELGRQASSVRAVQVPVQAVQAVSMAHPCFPQSAVATGTAGADEEKLASDGVNLRARSGYFSTVLEESVSASESTFVEEHGMTARSGDDGWAEDRGGSNSPSDRLAQLEAEYEQLKNQMEGKATLQEMEQMRQAIERLEASKGDISQSEIVARSKPARSLQDTEQQKLIDELQAKLVKLEKESSATIAGLRREVEQLQQRHEEARRTESDEMQVLRCELENSQKKGQMLEQQVQELRNSSEQMLARLREEKEGLAADLEALRRQNAEAQQPENTLGRKIEENNRELRAFADARTAETSPSTVASLQTQVLASQPLGSLVVLQDHAMSLDVNHPFVVKVQEACSGVEIAIANADHVHLASLESQLQSASDSLKRGLSASSGFYDCELKPQIALERQVAASRLESRMRDLIAIREEAGVYHDLDEATTKKRLLGQIDNGVARCEAELQLFEPSVPGDVPETVIVAILNFVDGRDSKDCDGSFSPAHWAAEKGRRDLILYILQHAGGEAMLQSTDDTGRTPLFYALRGNRIVVVHYVKSVLGSQVARPDVGKLPSAYKKALEQVESRGWHVIKWKDHFTMLHWAAGKGHEDLCAYLIHLNADPTAKDGQGRTPLDCAAAADRTRVVQLLEEASALVKSQDSSKLATQEMLSGA
eukprot:TRINITY_DN75019_c0_g1_i1.p1 TRINITY_DN75019_c0_g1~~TRINITY_DN75019_c0_g1_i1.p1  ORF type:complete len:827 (+),score=153.16 TRINITY_DN75019_c0_g1_i1:49-2529(+)